MRISLGRRHVFDKQRRNCRHPFACLGRNGEGVLAVQTGGLFQFRRHPFHIGGGQVNLVENGNDDMVILHRLPQMSQCLCLHALTGIHQQQNRFTRRQGTRDFVRKIHMPRGVQQIENPLFSRLVTPRQTHRLTFDGDAALALQFHRIQSLGLGFIFINGAAEFHQAVGKGGFAVIHMGDDAEITNGLHHHLSLRLWWSDRHHQ